MAFTTINKSGVYFNTNIWSGNSSTQALTGVGFQPDWTWIKRRSGNGVYSHMAFDSVRGVTKSIVPDTTAAEGTQSNGLTAFGADGFTLGDASAVNITGSNYVGWNWRAGNSAGSANSDGNTSTTVSVNTTAGFSVVKWTGTSGNTTIGHGLGATPAWVIMKNTGGSGTNWVVYSKSLKSGYFLKLNTTAAHSNSNVYFTSAPTSSLLSLTGGTAANNNGNSMIAYCFAEKNGYSRFGYYMGNGNADGPFVYTGFAPAFVLQREVAVTRDWTLIDSVRSPHNERNDRLVPNENALEVENNSIDLLSNGFKVRSNQTNSNDAGQSYIYMAFGQSIVGTNDVPCTAR